MDVIYGVSMLLLFVEGQCLYSTPLLSYIDLMYPKGILQFVIILFVLSVMLNENNNWNRFMHCIV